MRTISLEPQKKTISPHVFIRLTQLKQGYLLPGLTSIVLPDGNSSEATYLFVILSPHLKSVELNGSAIRDKQLYLPYLSALATESPMLQRLCLRGTTSVDIGHVLRFKCLRILELELPDTYIFPNILEGIGDLEDLVELKLHGGAPSPISTPSTSFDITQLIGDVRKHRRFRQLKIIHVIGRLSSLAPLLQQMNLVSLSSAIIEELPDASNAPTSSFWTSCFHSLSSSQALESIRIEQSPTRSSGNGALCLTVQHLSPLFGLQDITSLIVTNASFSGTDADFAHLLSAFPSLETLELPAIHQTDCPSFKSLSHLSLHNSHIKTLKVCVTSTGNKDQLMSELDAVVFPRKHAHPLKDLQISSGLGQLSYSEIICVARYLDRAFPSLQLLQGYGSQATSESWGQVQEFRVALQDARRGAI